MGKVKLHLQSVNIMRRPQIQSGEMPQTHILYGALKTLSKIVYPLIHVAREILL